MLDDVQGLEMLMFAEGNEFFQFKLVPHSGPALLENLQEQEGDQVPTRQKTKWT